MRNTNKKTAFISGITRSRGKLPFITNKVMQEMSAIDRNQRMPLTKMVKDVLFDVLEYQAKSAMKSNILGGRFKADTASVAKDGLGFDNTGVVKIVSEFESKPTAHYSATRESICVKRHKYSLSMNKRPSGKFNSVPHGYRKVSRILLNTKTDCLRIEDRIDLTTKSGFNESIVDIFDKDGFLTMEDLHLITDCKDIVSGDNRRESAKELINGRIIKNSDVGDLKKGLARQQLSEVGTSRIYSKILKLKTELEIHSDVTGYMTYVTVHLCAHKMYSNCGGALGSHTTQELCDGILDDVAEKKNRSLRRRQILKLSPNREKGRNFKRTITVEPGSRILESQVLRDNVSVLKTFRFMLKPSEIGMISLTHNFTRGLDLKDLSKSLENEAAASTFFIVEASGDKNGRVTSKNFDEAKMNGLSPIALRYEARQEMSWISEDNKPDVPATFKTEQKEELFEDINIGELFYPTRVNTQNISLENLEINRDNPKAEFRLDMDGRSNLQSTIIDRAQDTTKKNWMDLDDAIEFANMLKNSNDGIGRSLKGEGDTISGSDDIVSEAENIFDDNNESDITYLDD